MPIIATCVDLHGRDCFIWYWLFYTIGKEAIIIVMLCYVQTDMLENWDKELCPNLYKLGIFWIIWNYIQLVYAAVFLIVDICLCTNSMV